MVVKNATPFVFLTLFFTRERINVAAMMEFVDYCCIHPPNVRPTPARGRVVRRDLAAACRGRNRLSYCHFKNGRDIVFK